MVRSWVVTLAFTTLLSWAAASVTVTPGDYHGKPGDVVVVHLTASGTGRITATPSKAVLFLGTTTPSAGAGQAIATFLVESGAPAGDYQVELEQGPAAVSGTRATAHIRVDPVAHAKVTLSGPRTITAGGSGHFSATITNDGNIADVYTLSIATNDSASLSTPQVTLKPNASRTLELTIRPLGFGNRIAILSAQSTSDPTYGATSLIRYASLAFGATDPNAPFLAYSLPLGATYGSQGLTYHAGLSLSGDLSSLANTKNAFAVSPKKTQALVGIYGDTWGVTYSYDNVAGNNLFVGYEGLGASVQVTPAGRTTTTASYGANGWSVSYSHEWGPLAKDRLLTGFTFAPSSDTILTVSAGAAGEVRRDGTYHVSPAAAIDGSWNGQDVIISVSGAATPYLESPWNASLTVNSRQTRPISLGGSVYTDPSRTQANFTVTETPSKDFQAQQSVSYTYPTSVGSTFSAAYTPKGTGPDLFGVAQLSLSNGVLTGKGLVTFNLTRVPWIASGSVELSAQPIISFGETYLTQDYSVSGSVALPLATATPNPTIGLRGTYATQGALLNAGVSFAPVSLQYAVSTGLSLPFFPGLNVLGQVGYDSTGGFTWEVGATASIQGAFAVPSTVVKAFGGLDDGTVTGVITKRTDSGVEPAAGVLVSTEGGDRAVKTDKDGRYRLVLKPGSYILAFPDLNPQLQAPADLTFQVERQKVVRKDAQLTVSYAITGQVFVDVAGTGKPTSAATGMANAEVELVQAGKRIQTARTSSDGSFAFRALQPGIYRVAVVTSSLPTGYRATTKPTTTTVSNQGLPFVSLGVQPPKATVKTTLGSGSIALNASVSPTNAPPRALVSVSAKATNASAVSVTTSDGTITHLHETQAGRFVGDVTIPKSAKAVELLKVVASNATDSESQNVMVFINDAPLASITLSPGYADAGTAVAVAATVRTAATKVELRINGRTINLKASGKQSYSGTLTAPKTKGSYEVQLYVDGERAASRTLEVVSGN